MKYLGTISDGKDIVNKEYVDDHFTSTSVIPNNSGEIKTKYRVSNKGYTGSSSTVWYFPLAKLPVDNTGNYASLLISGRIGGWVSENMSSISALVWNRNSTGIALLDIAGTATSMSSIWNICDIVVYTNSDNTDTVYLKATGYYTFDLDLELYQSTASILYDGSYSTSVPSGTLNAQASTSTKRVEILNGQLLVAGSSMVPVSRTVNGKALTGDITLSASDVGAATSGHTHTTSIATSTGTNQITLSGGGKYAITAGGTSYIFTMPSIPSIPSNNVTGSGTSGQLAQWSGTNTITSGPKITASTNAPSGGSNGDIWFVYS